MRRFQLTSKLHVLVCGFLVLTLVACGGSSGDDGRSRSAQSGVFIDSPVNGLAYQTPTRSGSTGAGAAGPGGFSYLQGENVSFRLDCLLLGTTSGRAIITPRTLASGDAATNIARMLLTLDADGNNANGIDVGYVDLPTNLCSIDFAQFPESDFETFVEQLRSNGSLQRNQDPTAYDNANDDVVGSGYANSHLNCSEQGQTFANGACGNAPALSINNVSLNEGNSGTTTFTFTVTRSGNTNGNSSVTVTTADNTASVADNDYAAVSGSVLSFGSGVNSQTINISVNGDTAIESNETFFVNLSDATGAVIADGQGVGTIVNDDAAPGQSLFSINDVAADEGDAGSTTFSFTVSRTGDTSVSASVTVETADNTAMTADNDYEAVAPMVLTFGPSVLSQSVAVTVNGDTMIEPNETFFVNLSNTVSGTITDGQGVGTIQNDDSADPGSPSASIDDVAADEGGAGTTTQFVFTVTLDDEASQAVQITYRAIGSETESGLTATAGQDFVGKTGNIEIAAGQTTGTITIDVNGDAFQENDETFAVEITSISSNATVADGVAIGTIVNDDTITLLMAGAAKRTITPDQKHIDGMDETRLGVAPKKQKFNLGGFGINPVQNFPDPAGELGEQLTEPAGARAFEGTRGVEDTHVRAMVIAPPDGGDSVAFVMIDAVGAGNLIQNGLKAAINARTNNAFKPENILFGQTHTHAGADLQGLWGGVPEDWINNILYKQAADAVAEALAELQPARLTLQQGQTVQFNNYRRPRIDPAADADGTLTLLQAAATDGSPIGSILQYNAHPTSINEDPRVPHADYIQGAMDWLENSDTGPGGVAMYYNGPIADASGSGRRVDETNCSQNQNENYTGPDANYGAVRCRGEGIAENALSFQSRELQPTLSARHEEVILPVTNPLFFGAGLLGAFNRYYDFVELPADQIPGIGPQVQAGLVQLPQVTPTARTLVSRITIGGVENGLEIVTIPGEATNTFGQYIRDLAGTDVMLLGLTQNSFGYILPEEEFSYVEAVPKCVEPSENPFCNAGLVVPFTGYEEFVSLGPLTAPLLRIQGYNPLFEVGPEANLPPYIAACQDPLSEACVINVVGQRIDYIQRGYAEFCRRQGGPEEFCALLDPQTPLVSQCLDAGFPAGVCAVFGQDGGGSGGSPLDPVLTALADVFQAMADGCRDLGGPDELCSIFDTLTEAVGGDGGTPGAPGVADADLLPEAIKAIVQGCDILDPAHCLFPFPSDQFTVAAPAGSPQAAPQGTGKRINFNILAMPRNVAGKPVDPTEWNRNDGFSPGAMVMTYVPNLGTVKDAQGSATGPITGAVSLTELDRYLDTDAPVVVIDTVTGARHPVWAEIDLNAGKLLPSMDVASPKPAMPALIIRPASNFIEGHRYVVALRNLLDQAGQPIGAGAAFATCRDEVTTLLPPLQQRCAALEANVFEVLDDAEIERDESLYLAWDFTVASARNQTSRLVHMRDDAFRNVLGDQEDADGNILSFGRAPAFTITEIKDSGIDSRLARVVRGTFTIPSYLIPSDASPLDGQSELRAQLKDLAAQAPAELNALLDQCDDVDPTGIFCDFLDPDDAVDLAASGSLPPNRLLYNPADGFNPSDPQGSLYGNGLPDRNPSGEMTATFTCNIPKTAVDNPGTARPSLYGHGLLGGQNEGGVGGGGGPVTQMGGEHNMMFCATDWFGFATGDVPNVLAVLLDLSLFPVVPDAGQQGALNFMFLARLMSHPSGFASDPAFQVSGSDARPVFDRREVFYDGNSQGGILGGPVIAVSKDVNRGVLGVPAQNYSTLLARSVDFDLYSVPLYLAYPDDLDRNLGFALIQMLWDRSENNGYTQNLTRASLGGPKNEVLLHPAFADHQVSHWAAQVMARTIGVEVADMYPRRLSECGGNVTFCYDDDFAGKQAFFDERDPDVTAFWDLPLVGRPMSGGSYDSPATACSLAEMMLGQCGRNTKSAYVEFDKGETATPPIGNVPPRADGFDPHSFPRATRYGNCQKSHFLHTQGRIIDVRDTRDVVTAGDCPALPAAVGTPLDGGSFASSSVLLCAPDVLPGIGGQCIEVSSIPVLGPVLASLLNPVDGVTETLADGCHDNAGPLEPACVVTDSVAQLIQQGQDTPPPVDSNNASCATDVNTTGNRSYQVTIPSESGETISFQVLEPAAFNCAQRANGAHPLILQGHGFGGSRSTSGFADYRNAGYTVISIDQRGFGQSSGTVRTMDPDYEGRDLVQILDWAETNLDYLAYRDEGDADKPFVARPNDGESESGGENLVVGAIGGSYGGGFQFLLHNVDEKDRLDALAPDITWHDLRYSLNPGDTLKSAFGLLLSVGGTQGSYQPALENQEVPTNRGLDPYIVETLARAVATGEFPRESLEWFRYHSPTYWCDLRDEPKRPYEFADWGDVDPNTMLGTLAGDVPGSNRRTGQPGVDILLSQGFRDNLFNFNEAWWNYQCARVRGGDEADVRLITHQSGHILNLGGLTGQDIPPGTPLDVQTPGTTNNCGALNRGNATVAWFNEKLRGSETETAFDLTNDSKLCLSLSDDDAVFVPEANMLAPRATEAGFPAAAPETTYYQIAGVGAASVPQGVLALTLHNAGQLSPSVVPLLSVGDANGLIVAGIPQATITVRTPAGVNDAACEAGANVPSLRTGCDSIIYVGLGKKSGDGAWVLIDDQITPVRGLGTHNLEMVGVGERLAQGDELALLIYGYHPQYIASYSRDVSIPAVNVEADLQLPLYVATSAAANSAPDFLAPAAGAVNGIATGTGCTDPSYTGVDAECIATGTGVNVVRQLCDYQWLPGVCEMFAHPDPQYVTDADPSPGAPLRLMVGAVHEHSGYSDGDPTAIPRDYFRAGRTGHNVADNGVDDTGVILDFMFSSEHSDNEKLPVTTSAACIPFSQSFADDPASLLQADPTGLVQLLDCSHALDSHHYFKWLATLEQAIAESTYDTDTADGFTAIRGFEWTNDYYNHMNVYFSTNVVNVKVDGSMLSMDFFWDWLRRPVAEGGGADALLTFNHPGGDPALSPFDGGQPHNELLQQTRGGANWNDVAYVDAEIDARVVGIEVNGGDDIEWYVKALSKGWHIGPVAAEDEHQREWSTTSDGKTLILSRGRTPRDYYYAFKHRRTVAIRQDLVNGTPGNKALFPQIHLWADGGNPQVGTPLGSIVETAGTHHTLHVDIDDVPAGYKVAMLSNTGGGQLNPVPLGIVNAAGNFTAVQPVTAPASGQDWYFVVICPPSAGNCGSDQNYSAVTAPIWFGPGGPSSPPPAAATEGYGPGLIGAIAQYMARLHGVLVALVSGDVPGAGEQLVAAVTEFVDTLSGLPDEVDPARPGTTLVGLNGEPDEVLAQTTDAAREVEPVILTGDRLGAWSVPAAQGAPYPYPSGATQTGAVLDPIHENDPTGLAPPGQVRDAHNGVILYPPAGGAAPTGVPVDQIAAYKYEDGDFVEIPVQVDEKFPYFLANANSDFSVYSGTDEELTYAWDKEHWDPLTSPDGCNAIFPDGQPDPVAGLDADDEIVFMASDAGAMAPAGELPEGDAVQMVRLVDALDPAAERVVYLVQKAGGSSFDAPEYVNFQRNADADQWIDRTFFADSDPEKIGTSNTGYGPNLSGSVCHPTDGTKNSNDRFPRDGTVVSTDTYRWEASGRWMIRDIRIAPPGGAPYDWSESANVQARADIIDRWKGRAFQQSPDSNISVVGFEDEQVNWEANAGLLGERCGPVRCIREVWGADSGTNVTKTETFYRDAVTYRYRVRVHPIPPDGLYTSWDYNRGAMLPTVAEIGAGVQPGRYYTVLRPQGVPIDGVNDDVGQVDGITPVNGQCVTLDGPQPPASNGLCPAFFDAADPTFNLTLAFNNWEQVSGKGDLGSMVYIFENKGPTSYGNPLVVPYYRDDACLDDGTGDDPVQRPYPGERSDDSRVVAGYVAANGGRPYEQLACHEKQGAHGAHGIHYFVTHDTDNAFVEGKPLTEIDGQQWQFMVPTAQPTNVGDRYANVVRVPLQTVVVPLNVPVPGVDEGEREGGLMGLLGDLATDFQNYLAALVGGDVEGALAALQVAFANLGGNLAGLLTDDPNASVASTVAGAVANPTDNAGLLASAERLINGYLSGDAGTVRAGVGVVDMTPDVGYGAGQYSDTTNIFDGLAGGEIDPYLTHKKQKASYGVQSRLTARAIVIEGNNGKRIVLLKSDNYLAQDNLLRRVGQILQANGSSIGYPQILYHVSHAHSTTYSSTLAAGVAAFQDVYDARFFEDQARKLAQAILTAEADLKPARMGATTVRHKIYKGNIVRLATADDGTPAGYPLEYGDLGLVVMRFDEVNDSGDFVKPLAVWVNWGEHPESLDGHDLHSADFLAPLERFVERDLGAPLVFSQGDVGSAENSGNANQRIADNGSVCGTAADASDCPAGQGVLRDWNHKGYVQTERNVRFLADGIVKGWKIIGGELPVDASVAGIPPNNYVPQVQVAMSSDFPVDYRNGWVPGPLSHPYPSVSNCRTEKTVEGDIGVPVVGLPDCAREGIPGENPVNDAAALIYETAKAEGLPVPEHYDAPSALALEENARLKLQAFRLGEVLLASCACEAQVDLILNFESRADDVANNIYNGFDWACLLPAHRNDPQYAAACDLQEAAYFNPVEFPTAVAGNAAGQGNAALIARMRAQVHNNAAGWDALENVAFANAEPANPAEIKGNFTHEELPAERGYKLAVGIGHAGDYNGYTVSYREYMRGDHYRKALTAYGPHTADYMVTRMVRMAGAMKGGPELAPEPLDTAAQADEVRQLALTTAHGQVTKAAYDTWLAALPPDVGPAEKLIEPTNITHFSAATFRWRGGGTQVDNPVVRVEKQCTEADIDSISTDLASLWLKQNCMQAGEGNWSRFSDMTGEVQTRVHWPEGIPGVVSTYTGQFAWEWTANFEAYEAFPARLGSTPLGNYRFVVSGCINDDLPGSLQRRAESFVSADACPGGARPYEMMSIPFAVNAAVETPRSYSSVFPFIGDNGDPRICDTCSFRPWATH